jgi:transposase
VVITLGKPISNDKREAIIKHKQAGESESNITKWLLISPRTVQRVWKKYKETGSYEPNPLNNGRKPQISQETMDKIVMKIQEMPDMTLRELIDEFNLGISQAALCKRLIKLGLSFKKRHFIQTDKSEKML